MTDPFTEVLQKIWELLESRSDITSVVSLGNRIKLWEGKLKPEGLQPDDDLSPSDLPLIIIEPVGGAMNPFHTSTDGYAVQGYRIRMMDGNLLLHKIYFPLKWAIFKALASLSRKDGLLNLSYVRKIEIEDGTDEQNTTGHPGWTLGIDIKVHLWWSREYLRDN